VSLCQLLQPVSFSHKITAYDILFGLPNLCIADPVLRMLRKGIWGNNEQRRWWELCTGVSSAAKVRKELITDTG
jgi:hypothetical protein